MNQFPTLIEYLLLNHNYVVIPGLGTFIVQQMNAKRNDSEEAFIPPYRLVRFNTELSHDDQLVASAIAHIYSTTLTKAAQMLGLWTDEFLQDLEENEYIEFGAIGTFTFSGSGNMAFTPAESGVTTPDFYGLDAFHMSEIRPANNAKVVPLAASMETSDKEITIHINRRIANVVVAACAAILLFMTFNLPIQHTPNIEQHSSLKELLMPTSAINGNVDIDSNIESAVEASGQAANSQEAFNEKATNGNHEKSSTQAPNRQDEYCIVLASAISMSNAEKYVETLTERGFLSARILNSGNMVRVVVGHYQTEEEAAIGANGIRQRDSEYKDVWVYHI